jgi:hypothetical protein
MRQSGAFSDSFLNRGKSNVMSTKHNTLCQKVAKEIASAVVTYETEDYQKGGMPPLTRRERTEHILVCALDILTEYPQVLRERDCVLVNLLSEKMEIELTKRGIK